MIPIPRHLERSLSASVGALLKPAEGRDIDFSQPPGENALVLPDSVSWRIFKNPVALLIGGVAAVILELSEPAVRTGVWQYSSFRSNPMNRLQRTGLAAMVTIYGARSIAEPMIASIVRKHARVTGSTPDGLPYSANDARLLNWVHSTASYSFAEAYGRYVSRLTTAEADALYREGVPVSRLYGAIGAPESSADLQALFDSMKDRLEPSPIIFEFLQIMRETPAFPPQLRWLQRMLIRAAVDIIPGWIRARVGLSDFYGLRPHERIVVGWAASLADKICLPLSPAAQSCRRLGLPMTFLYA